MKRGEVVEVYEDPITETRREGTAHLVKLLNKGDHVDGGRLERWEVRFLYEKRTVERSILNGDKANEIDPTR